VRRAQLGAAAVPVLAAALAAGDAAGQGVGMGAGTGAVVVLAGLADACRRARQAVGA
jgi:hypothetical protein